MREWSNEATELRWITSSTKLSTKLHRPSPTTRIRGVVEHVWNAEIRKYGNMEIWECGNIWKFGNMGIRKYGVNGAMRQRIFDG